jgi:alpha-D-ribose 1-methylphosphonate 5-triphosphate synthase subunit PhnG
MTEALSEVDPNSERTRWLEILARAKGADELQRLLKGHLVLEPCSVLRQPEVGLVMVRARADGNGQAFSAGEITITRCSVQDASGRIGHGFVAGRDREHARLMAMLDVALQYPSRRALIEECVLKPISARVDADRTSRARKAAGTRVDFFALNTARS